MPMVTVPVVILVLPFALVVLAFLLGVHAGVEMMSGTFQERVAESERLPDFDPEPLEERLPRSAEEVEEKWPELND